MIGLKFLLQPFRDDSWRYCFHSGTSQQEATSQQDEKAALGQNQALTNQAQGTLGQFEGPVQNSPFYKALLTQGTEATSNAYNQARSNQAQKANLSGFGYSQPVAQGGQAQLGAQEAASMAEVPQTAMLAAEQPALQTAGETAQLAGQQGGMSTGFGGQATQSDIQNQQNSLWNKLWTLPQAASQGVGAYFGAQ